MFSKKPSIHLSFISALFLVLYKMRREGYLSVEADIEQPEHERSVFAGTQEIFKYPAHFQFMLDVLRMMLMGVQQPQELTFFAATAKKAYMDADGKDEALWDCIWAMLYAAIHGNTPQVAAEFGRQAIPPKSRPSFNELEDLLKESRYAHEDKVLRVELDNPESMEQAIDALFARMASRSMK